MGKEFQLNNKEGQKPVMKILTILLAILGLAVIDCEAANRQQKPTPQALQQTPQRRFKVLPPMPANWQGKIDPRMDPRLRQAANYAISRARAHPKLKCWRYVKDALWATGVVKTRPKTPLAKQAATELVERYGFKELPIKDPYAAPIGSVIVYNRKGAPGHVEIRAEYCFVSDHTTKRPVSSWNKRYSVACILTRARSL